MRGDRVEIVVDSGNGVLKYEIEATKAGRRVEVSTSRGTVEVIEVTRTGNPVRSARFMASRVVAVVEHPAPMIVRAETPSLKQRPRVASLAARRAGADRLGTYPRRPRPICSRDRASEFNDRRWEPAATNAIARAPMNPPTNRPTKMPASAPALMTSSTNRWAQR